MKSKSTAALLAFFLGGIGIHKFYLGKTSQGIMYLLFCWTLIPGLIAFIEFILFLVMSREEFDSKYNTHQIISNIRASSAGRDIADEVEKLYRLKEIGAITEQEYNSRKNKLI